MDILKLYSKEIFSVFVALFTWVLNNHFKAKAALSYGFQHEFKFLLNEPLRDVNQEIIANTQLVHTQSLIFVNEGRESATDITLVFNFKPMYMNFWPIHHYEETVEKDNRYIVKFESMPPKDSIRCEVFSVNQDLPHLLSIRSKECVAKKVNLVPVKAISPVLARAYISLLFIGVGASTYMAITLLRWLLVKAG